MRDAVSSVIKQYDTVGRYLDRSALDRLQGYFQTGAARIQAARVITLNSTRIVKGAAAQLFSQVPDLIRPGGNAYTTRRYATCLRDMDYYLRYATYALVAGDATVLNERVLNGLRETYNSLGVPLGPTVVSIEALKQQCLDVLGTDTDYSFAAEPFEVMAAGLSEVEL